MKSSHRKIIRAMQQPGAYLSPPDWTSRMYYVRLSSKAFWKHVLCVRETTIQEMKANGLIEVGTLRLTRKATEYV